MAKRRVTLAASGERVLVQVYRGLSSELRRVLLLAAQLLRGLQ